MNSILFLVTITFLSAQVKCGDKIPERVCATLFSEVGLEGKTFLLKDFDISVNLGKEYRHSLEGWMHTGSISVSDGCTVMFCTDTYLAGDCISFNSATATSFKSSSVFQSVECICQRKCSCSDIDIPRDFYKNGIIARAYLDDGCDKCNGEYLHVYNKKDIADQYTKRIKAFIIPEGCDLTYYNKKNDLTIKGPVYKPNFNEGPFRSVSLSCYDNSSVPVPGETQNDARLLKLPASFDELYDMLRLNNNTYAQLGLSAALKSAQNRRSASAVYIIFVGIAKPYWSGFPQCRSASGEGKIWECNIFVAQPDLGISAELRLIVVPVGDTTDQSKDYELMAILDKHLSSIKDLENAVPNAVIIHDYVEERYSGMNSPYFRKLRLVLAMSSLLLDESNPNVIFMLDRYDATSRFARQPNQVIKSFEMEIRKWWQFPINICLAPVLRWAAPHANGYDKMPNMEYWPLNLAISLNYICERGEDPLGRAILKAYFQDNRTPLYSVIANVLKIQADKDTVKKYREFSINGR